MSPRLTNHRIEQAIRERKLLGIVRSQGSTVIKPHILYETKSGVLQVSGAYVSGYTTQGGKTRWRQYPLRELRSVEVLGDHFEDSEPDYDPDNSRYQRVLCALPVERSLTADEAIRKRSATRRPCPSEATYLQVIAPDSSLTAYDIIHGRVPAGPARPEDEGDLGRLVMDLSAIGIPTTENTFALRVEGDSMSGAGINDGDILVLERREPRSGDVVAALVDRHVTLKRYIVTKEGSPILRAENPNHADIVPLEALKIQGVAIGLIRKL